MMIMIIVVVVIIINLIITIIVMITNRLRPPSKAATCDSIEDLDLRGRPIRAAFVAARAPTAEGTTGRNWGVSDPTFRALGLFQAPRSGSLTPQCQCPVCVTVSSRC